MATNKKTSIPELNELRCKIYAQIASLYMLKGDYRDSMKHAEIAMRLAEKFAPQLIPLPLSVVGSIMRHTGDYKKALERYKKSLAISKKKSSETAIALNNIGTIRFIQGDYPKARDCWRRASKICRKLSDKRNLGSILYNLGIAEKVIGNHPKAMEFYNRSLDVIRETGHVHAMQQVLAGLGSMYCDRCEYEKALALYNEALAINRRTGAKREFAFVLMNIGTVFSLSGDDKSAEKHYNQSLAVARKLSNKSQIGQNFLNLGMIKEKTGDYPRAMKYFEEALAVFKELQAKPEIGNAFIAIVSLSTLTGRTARLCPALSEFLKIVSSGADKADLANDLNTISHLLSVFGEKDIKKRCLEASASLQNTARAATLLNVFCELGLLALEDGDISSAESYLAKAENISRGKAESAPDTLKARLATAQGDFKKAVKIADDLCLQSCATEDVLQSQGIKITAAGIYLKCADLSPLLIRKAETLLNAALRKAQKKRWTNFLPEIYQNLSLACELKGDRKISAEYLRKAALARKSLLPPEREKKQALVALDSLLKKIERGDFN